MRIHDPRPLLPELARWLLPAIVAAGILGFLVGGVGGRLAMLVLRLTSGPDVIGLESDDGFTIGRISGDTVFLVAFATVGSALFFGPFYAVARRWVPGPYRSLAFGTLLGLFGGAVIVQTDGVDFTELSPRALAVALFIGLPAAFGAALEPMYQFLRSRIAKLPVMALTVLAVPASLAPAFFGPPFVLLVLIGWASVLLGQERRVTGLVDHAYAAWVARGVGLTIALIAAQDLARDVDTLLL